MVCVLRLAPVICAELNVVLFARFYVSHLQPPSLASFSSLISPSMRSTMVRNGQPIAQFVRVLFNRSELRVDLSKSPPAQE
jgi:hypothetical protein